MHIYCTTTCVKLHKPVLLIRLVEIMNRQKLILEYLDKQATIETRTKNWHEDSVEKYLLKGQLQL